MREDVPGILLALFLGIMLAAMMVSLLERATLTAFVEGAEQAVASLLGWVP